MNTRNNKLHDLAETLRSQEGKITDSYQMVRSHWIERGTAMLEAKRLLDGDTNALGKWVREEGIDKLRGLTTSPQRSDCIWLAEYPTRTALIDPTDAASPGGIRRKWRALVAKHADDLAESGEPDANQELMALTFCYEDEAVAAMVKALAKLETPEPEDEPVPEPEANPQPARHLLNTSDDLYALESAIGNFVIRSESDPANLHHLMLALDSLAAHVAKLAVRVTDAVDELDSKPSDVAFATTPQEMMAALNSDTTNSDLIHATVQSEPVIPSKEVMQAMLGGATVVILGSDTDQSKSAALHYDNDSNLIIRTYLGRNITYRHTPPGVAGLRDALAAEHIIKSGVKASAIEWRVAQ